MNTIQAEALARIIDKLEREGCTRIQVAEVHDTKDYLWLHVEFEIPAEHRDAANEVS